MDGAGVIAITAGTNSAQHVTHARQGHLLALYHCRCDMLGALSPDSVGA